jgi:hypothetical protein
MLIKIGLPNPYMMKTEMFFTQMRIAIKACEKAYEEATKDLTEEQKEDCWLAYRHPDLEEALKKSDSPVELGNYEDEQQDLELHLGN